MINKYTETIAKVKDWARREDNVAGVIVIGSLAREQLEADQWSDLDLMVFVKDIQILVNEHEWLAEFGQPICYFNAITPFHWADWDWIVKRALYADNRDVDFSILRFDRLDDVLAVNQSIMAKGCEVIYDAQENLLTAKINQLLIDNTTEEFRIPTEPELNAIINEILYHIIWAYKKIKRHELWVGVSLINTTIKNLLLQLIEIYNVTVAHSTNFIMFEGRFLERRTPPEVLEKLSHCVTKYDEQAAIDTLGHVIEITEFIVQAICAENDLEMNTDAFEGIRKLYTEM
jgi:hypothetical protein